MVKDLNLLYFRKDRRMALIKLANISEAVHALVVSTWH